MWRQWIPFWHEGVSPYGGDVDLLFAGLLVASALVLGLLLFLILLFCIRYRAGNDVDRENHEAKSWHWEIGWTAASLLAFLGLFAWGAAVFLKIYQTPADDLVHGAHLIGDQALDGLERGGGHDGGDRR